MQFEKFHATVTAMTLKERTHLLVEAMPEDSPRLREVCEQLAQEKAIEDGLQDLRAGRVIPAEEAIKELRERWAKRDLKSS